MNFMQALMLGLLNSIKDPVKVPEKTPLGPQTPEELAQAREALLGKGDDEIKVPTAPPDPRFAQMTRGKELWSGYPGKGIVPYVISPELEKHKNLILQAMEQYHKLTCIRFVPRKRQRNYIKLVDGEGCSSFIGKMGGKQLVTLGKGCYYVGTIVHELGHAIGLHHEQKRPDRDNYINIYRNHVKEDKLHNFHIAKNIPKDVLSLPYNYDSIMHYGNYAFSKKNNVLVTMVAKNGHKLQEAYYKPGLTVGDVSHIRKLYKCFKKY